MNRRTAFRLYDLQFLNGVCRHELLQYQQFHHEFFLNGVCRHEPCDLKVCIACIFLNGVCRHEQQNDY